MQSIFWRKSAAQSAVREVRTALIWRLVGNMCEGKVDKKIDHRGAYQIEAT